MTMYILSVIIQFKFVHIVSFGKPLVRAFPMETWESQATVCWICFCIVFVPVMAIFNSYCSWLACCWQKKSKTESFSALFCGLPADVHLTWSKKPLKLETAATNKSGPYRVRKGVVLVIQNQERTTRGLH